MLNSLFNTALRLFDDSSIEYLQNRLTAGLENFKKTFGAYFSTLEDKEDYYELTLDVADDAKASNVTVDFDDETRELTVEYKYESKNFNSKSVITEVLPEDADEDTIEATVEDGKLVVTIEKKEEPEEVEEEEVYDDTVVKVTRNARK